jgi:putative acyl-CoA dehydrogenase
MTYSAAPVLRLNPALAAEWEPRLHESCYDPSFRPAAEKSGILIGMAMTEKQGGSDVRANITRAQPIGDGAYALEGHKWFCSAPMSDAFLVLAQAPAGLSCFFLPRWTPDGRRNGIEIQRLKSKLGNRSNASAEVEFHGAWAQLVGEEGRGVPTIIEMVQHTRLDCTLGSAALMRRALVEALQHCRYRQAFGRRLIEQPLMRNVLADLAIESEAATVLTLRVARAFDECDTTFARLAVAVAKYWTCRRAPVHVAEALECLGGNGYVEESVMPRLYREAPVNSIWEGSGNVIVLDASRTIKKEPEALERLMAEIRLARDPRVEKVLSGIDAEVAESEGRRVIERLAIALQASLLVRFSPPAVADAFCASRLEGDAGRAFGTLGKGMAMDDIIAGAALEI